MNISERFLLGLALLTMSILLVTVIKLLSIGY